MDVTTPTRDSAFTQCERCANGHLVPGLTLGPGAVMSTHPPWASRVPASFAIRPAIYFPIKLQKNMFVHHSLSGMFLSGYKNQNHFLNSLYQPNRKSKRKKNAQYAMGFKKNYSPRENMRKYQDEGHIRVSIPVPPLLHAADLGLVITSCFFHGYILIRFLVRIV